MATDASWYKNEAACLIRWSCSSSFGAYYYGTGICQWCRMLPPLSLHRPPFHLLNIFSIFDWKKSNCHCVVGQLLVSFRLSNWRQPKRRNNNNRWTYMLIRFFLPFSILSSVVVSLLYLLYLFILHWLIVRVQNCPRCSTLSAVRQYRLSYQFANVGSKLRLGRWNLVTVSEFGFQCLYANNGQ